MPKAHRDGDLRACGATTVVVGQSKVKVNGKLWAVDNDPNTHTAGGLIPTAGGKVKINGKLVITHTPNLARIDGAGHDGVEDETAEGSPNVYANGK